MVAGAECHLLRTQCKLSPAFCDRAWEKLAISIALARILRKWRMRGTCLFCAVMQQIQTIKGFARLGPQHSSESHHCLTPHLRERPTATAFAQRFASQTTRLKSRLSPFRLKEIGFGSYRITSSRKPRFLQRAFNSARSLIIFSPISTRR